METIYNLSGSSLEQLRTLFQDRRDDPQALAPLEEELRYRRTPQALALLIEVRGALQSPSAPGRALT